MINTEYKNDKFSIITDYEAFTNSIEETLLISELGHVKKGRIRSR